MADIFAASGLTVAIGQPLASKTTDFVESDFDTQSWINIGRVNNVGRFGDESQEITFDLMSEGRTQKLKGTRNAGNIQLICAVDYEDDGQATLRGAETEPGNYAFRIIYNNAPSGGTGSIRYFIARVMSASEEPGGANDVVRLNVTLGINSNVVQIAATA